MHSQNTERGQDRTPPTFNAAPLLPYHTSSFLSQFPFPSPKHISSLLLTLLLPVPNKQTKLKGDENLSPILSSSSSSTVPMGFLFSCRLSSRRPRAESDLAMIEASLRNCSIRRRGAAAGSHHPALDPATAAITVDLSSEVPPLPHQWHRFLDTQTGEIYYVNLADGTKTTQDPRKPQISTAAAAAADVLSDEDSNSVLVNEEEEDDDDDVLSSDASYGGDSDDDDNGEQQHIGYEYEPDYDGWGWYHHHSSSSTSASTVVTAGTSEASCSSSSSSSAAAAASGGQGQRGRRRGSGPPVLVLGGCRLCHSYFMVEKTASECPNCGGRLVHFGG